MKRKNVVAIIGAIFILAANPDLLVAQQNTGFYFAEYSGGHTFLTQDSEAATIQWRLRSGDVTYYVDSFALPIHIYDAPTKRDYVGLYVKYVNGEEALYAYPSLDVDKVQALRPCTRPTLLIKGRDIFATEHQRYYAVAQREVFKPIKYYIGQGVLRYPVSY